MNLPRHTAAAPTHRRLALHAALLLAGFGYAFIVFVVASVMAWEPAVWTAWNAAIVLLTVPSIALNVWLILRLADADPRAS